MYCAPDWYITTQLEDEMGFVSHNSDGLSHSALYNGSC